MVRKEKYNGNTLVGTVTETLYPTEYIINGVAYYRFDYRGVAAKEIGDVLTAELVFTRDGVEYNGEVDTYSLKAYAMERLEKSDNVVFKSLLVDLLNYGSAAQIYFGYRTESLVNADLSEAQKAFATQGYTSLDVSADSGDEGEYPVSITGKNVLFDDRIKLLIATNIGQDGELDGISLRIRYKDYLGRDTEKFISGSDFNYRSDVNGYTACFDGLKASELRTELELVLIKDGEEICATVRYGFDTYANNCMANSTNENFKELLKMTLIYSDSAKAYFSATK